MNRYQTSSPRKAFAIASIAMTAITLGLAVVVPAKMGTATRDVRTLAPMEVVAGPLHIDVVGARDPEVVSVQVRNSVSIPMAMPKRKQES